MLYIRCIPQNWHIRRPQQATFPTLLEHIHVCTLMEIIIVHSATERVINVQIEMQTLWVYIPQRTGPSESKDDVH